MFTGIVEELGILQSVKHVGNTLQLSIAAKKVLEDIGLGDSVSVNGVCLTVTRFSKEDFFVDVMPETFHSTSLHELKKGSHVNLERAMSANGRFGGHFVTGHVDTVGEIIQKEYKENAIYVKIAFTKNDRHVLLHKGSITVDGVSLTVFGVEDEVVTISIIPHTAKETVLGIKEVGEKVNLEFDMLGKYVYTFLRTQREGHEQGQLSVEFLQDNGFL